MWINFLSFCGSFILVMSLAFCLCWRRKQKSEWPGVDGVVIKKNPDENVNHLPTGAFESLPNNNKRQTLPSTTRRSLPDIPAEPGAVNWEPSGDNSSEHYATVGQYEHSLKRHTLPNGIEAKPSVSQHSSLSQADSPYERVKYDLIKSREHPYAQLQPAGRTNILENRNIPEESTSRNDLVSEPGPSSRVSNGSGMLDIPAATAVAGGIAASSDLPYMTPPITQTNFSGDSQDSSKGYTSISVREPLVNIMAQTKQINKRSLDPHYSTVSDDSDDVYTTIPDPNQVYTSESETYAKIPPSPITVEAEINPVQRVDSEELDDEMYGSQPIPPTRNSLKHVANKTHSRQASSSSSTGNVGSPKPEKRQANSPLPPTPPATDPDKPNIDDLYAKVQKSKSKSSDEDSSPEKQRPLPCINQNGHKPAEHSYETLRKPRPDYEKIKNEEPGYACINGPESISSSDPGYEVLKTDHDPNYEELKYRSNEANYMKNDPFFGYSVVNKAKKKEIDEPNYESMPSESVSEITYSGLKSSGSETDPNYECIGYKNESSKSYETLDTSESSDSGKRFKDRGYKKLSEFSSGSQDNMKSTSKDSSFERSSSDKSNEPSLGVHDDCAT